MSLDPCTAYPHIFQQAWQGEPYHLLLLKQLDMCNTLHATLDVEEIGVFVEGL